MGECQFRKNVAEPVFSQAYDFHCWLPDRNSYYVRIAHGKSAHPFTTHMSRSVRSATVIPPSVSGLKTARGCVSSACQPSLSHTYSFYQIPGNPTERNTVFTQFVLFFSGNNGTVSHQYFVLFGTVSDHGACLFYFLDSLPIAVHSLA